MIRHFFYGETFDIEVWLDQLLLICDLTNIDFTREDPLHSEGLYNRRKIRRYFRNQWRVFDSVINCAIALPNNYY